MIPRFLSRSVEFIGVGYWEQFEGSYLHLNLTKAILFQFFERLILFIQMF